MRLIVDLFIKVKSKLQATLISSLKFSTTLDLIDANLI